MLIKSFLSLILLAKWEILGQIFPVVKINEGENEINPNRVQIFSERSSKSIPQLGLEKHPVSSEKKSSASSKEETNHEEKIGKSNVELQKKNSEDICLEITHLSETSSQSIPQFGLEKTPVSSGIKSTSSSKEEIHHEEKNGKSNFELKKKDSGDICLEIMNHQIFSLEESIMENRDLKVSLNCENFIEKNEKKEDIEMGSCSQNNKLSIKSCEYFRKNNKKYPKNDIENFPNSSRPPNEPKRSISKDFHGPAQQSTTMNFGSLAKSGSSSDCGFCNLGMVWCCGCFYRLTKFQIVLRTTEFILMIAFGMKYHFSHDVHFKIAFYVFLGAFLLDSLVQWLKNFFLVLYLTSL